MPLSLTGELRQIGRLIFPTYAAMGLSARAAIQVFRLEYGSAWRESVFRADYNIALGTQHLRDRITAGEITGLIPESDFVEKPLFTPERYQWQVSVFAVNDSTGQRKRFYYTVVSDTNYTIDELVQQGTSIFYGMGYEARVSDWRVTSGRVEAAYTHSF